jgi:homoserine dehydrogenase
LEGNGVGPIMLYGQGAGDLPTGSAVLSDIMAIARTTSYNNTGFSNDFLKDATILEDKYTSYCHYFRFTVEDRPGVLAILAGIMGERNISIAQVVQRQERDGKYVPVVFLTHKAQLKNVKDAIEEIDRLSFVHPKTKHYRILL